MRYLFSRPVTLNGDPAKANGLCGERKSQDTAGIFHLWKMEHCILRFDESSAQMCLTSVFGMGSEGSAACGRVSDLSEWQRSARAESAPPDDGTAGHRDRKQVEPVSTC